MPLKEQLLTPCGFIKTEKAVQGTVVRTPGNGEAKIEEVFRTGQERTYTIRFSDGAETVCTDAHMWLSRVSGRNRTIKARTTAEIWDIIQNGKTVSIPLCGQVEFEGDYTLKIKPYTFGAIMGDGCTLGEIITVTKRDMELFDRIMEEGYVLKRYYANTDRTPVFGLKQFTQEKAWLGEKGLRCKGYKKYIPSEYKYASVEDRIDLIQGLMDTDGYVDKNGNCSFSSTSKRLAKDMQFLIRSVGGKARITSKIPTCRTREGKKKKCRRAYNVSIQMPDNRVLFSIPRKKNRCHDRKAVADGFHPGRRIVEISENGMGPGCRFRLDSQDGMYITGDFIVMHSAVLEVREEPTIQAVTDICEGK